MSQQITLYKIAERKLDRGVMRRQLAYAAKRMLAGTRGNVWACGDASINERQQGSSWVYTATMNLRRTGRDVDAETKARQIDKMRDIAVRALRCRQWSNTLCEEPQANGELVLPADDVAPSYAVVPEIIGQANAFSHLFGLDAQIEQVLSTVNQYVRSNFEDRFHAVLFGPPACGKTSILRGLSNMLGDDSVLHFDATSTTAAGAKQLLMEAGSVPPILCIEEIEKADEVSLRWLLGVLDYRAEIRSLKYRSGMVHKQVKLLCLATVNDKPLFEKMMSGALASRFTHQIHFPRPSRKVMEMILMREVERAKGDPAWIRPTLDWAEGKTTDPRKIIAVCLCGREKLLTGDYQKMLEFTAIADK